MTAIQIPCKLVLDYDFGEDCYSVSANTFASSPATKIVSSPCRAVEKRQRAGQGCSTPRKRPAIDRHVRFRQDTKQFDGLKPLSEALELIVWQFYTVQSIHSAGDILSFFKSRPHYKTVFKQVCSAINDLTELLRKNSCVDATIPVLPRGGGRGLLLSSAHTPTFKQLRDMFVSAAKLKSATTI